MTIDIAALDGLPETEPTALADLEGTGLIFCSRTCYITCFITEW
jgi:hypothetical protein